MTGQQGQGDSKFHLVRVCPCSALLMRRSAIFISAKSSFVPACNNRKYSLHALSTSASHRMFPCKTFNDGFLSEGVHTVTACIIEELKSLVHQWPAHPVVLGLLLGGLPPALVDGAPLVPRQRNEVRHTARHRQCKHHCHARQRHRPRHQIPHPAITKAPSACKQWWEFAICIYLLAWRSIRGSDSS